MWSDRQDVIVLEFQYSLDALTAGTVTPHLSLDRDVELICDEDQ